MSGPATESSDVPVIALEGALDADAIAFLERRAGDARVVLDLRAMRVVGTSSLSQFCVALRRLCSRGCAVAVVGAGPRVEWVLERCEIEGVTLHPAGGPDQRGRE